MFQGVWYGARRILQRHSHTAITDTVSTELQPERRPVVM